MECLEISVKDREYNYIRIEKRTDTWLYLY